MTDMEAMPPRLRAIVEEFAEVEGEEKLELLLEYADQMPDLPEWLHGQRDAMQNVPECMSPVFLHARHEADGMQFYFDIPREAPTVRGYAEILRQGLSGSSPEAVLQTPDDFFYGMGIQKVLSPQRLHGVSAVLIYMKRLTVKAMQAASSPS